MPEERAGRGWLGRGWAGRGWFDGAVAGGLVVLCAVVCWPLLRVGWVPSDEGTLAQSAARVLGGQLPQREFAEIYTGGLSVLDALAFRVWGENLLSLRLAVFVCFLAWVPVVYRVMRRWVSPWWAAVATLTAVGWSYPNYPAAMPSWYNLFCAVWGTAALLRFVETRRRWWLLGAGVCGGASVLVKVTGLYFIAAALLLLLFVEQGESSIGAGGEGGGRGGRVFRWLRDAGLVSFLAAVAVLLRSEVEAGVGYQFLLPVVTVVSVLWLRERGRGGRSSGERMRRLAGWVGPLAGGAALPVAAFAVPYAASGSLGALGRGVAGSVLHRVAGLSGRSPTPGLGYLVYALLPVGVVWVAGRESWSERGWVRVSVGAVLAAVVGCSALLPGLQDTWLMAGMLTPLVVLLGAWCLLRREGGAGAEDAGAGLEPRPELERELGREQLMVVVSVAAVGTLVQFPVSYVTYFCYAAPLTLAAAVAAMKTARVPRGGQPMLAELLVFYLGLGWLGVVPKHIYNPEQRWAEVRRLDVGRGGGLRVQPGAVDYGALVAELRRRSPDGRMYAGNDCPVLYFLSGLEDPTRDDTGAPAEEVVRAVRTGQVSLVVFNEEPFFASSAIAPEVRAVVGRELPQSERMGPYSLHWR